MTLVQIVILAVIQGLAELLPVSSSAHVIAAAKLMRIDPSTPAFGILLVMLHTGTMFAVIVYFWSAWKRAFFSSSERAAEFLRLIIIATIVTGVIGYGLKLGIEHFIRHSHPGIEKAEIEDLFKNTLLLAAALGAAGLLILYSGLRALAPSVAMPPFRVATKSTIAMPSSSAPFRDWRSPFAAFPAQVRRSPPASSAASPASGSKNTASPLPWC